LLEKGENGGGREKKAVIGGAVSNGARKWGTGRQRGATHRELRRGLGAMIGGGGRLAWGPWLTFVGGGGTGGPLGHVPAQTGESGG
jgi:hypothetical protein